MNNLIKLRLVSLFKRVATANESSISCSQSPLFKLTDLCHICSRSCFSLAMHNSKMQFLDPDLPALKIGPLTDTVHF